MSEAFWQAAHIFALCSQGNSGLDTPLILFAIEVDVRRT